MKYFILLAALILMNTAQLPQASADTFSEKLEKIRTDSQLPALGAMYLENGKIILSAMSGVRKWGNSTPAHVGDQFHLGSCTKAMTATLYAMLVEQGKVRWDSTLAELFPEVSSMTETYKTVTAEMVFAHRGGLPANADHQTDLLIKNMAPAAGRDLVAQYTLSRPAAVIPGADYLYSNIGYMLMGRVIEKIVGHSWEEHITETLFKPLGMRSCGFGPAGDPNASIPDQPWPHTLGISGLIPRLPIFANDNPPAYGPAGTVHCAMEDWAKFLKLHLDGFNHSPTAFLKSESFDKLHKAYPGQTLTYGGWIRETRSWAGGPVLTYEGSNGNNIALVWIAPLKNRIFMSVTNLGNTPGANSGTDAVIGELIQFAH